MEKLSTEDLDCVVKGLDAIKNSGDKRLDKRTNKLYYMFLHEWLLRKAGAKAPSV